MRAPVKRVRVYGPPVQFETFHLLADDIGRPVRLANSSTTPAPLTSGSMSSPVPRSRPN